MKNYLAHISYAEARQNIIKTGRQILSKGELFYYKVNGLDITIKPIDGRAICVHVRESHCPELRQAQIKKIEANLGAELTRGR